MSAVLGKVEPLVNTGCWTRYFEQRENGSRHGWSVLKNGTYEDFPYRLHYAEIVQTDPATARMEIFEERSHAY